MGNYVLFFGRNKFQFHAAYKVIGFSVKRYNQKYTILAMHTTLKFLSRDVLLISDISDILIISLILTSRQILVLCGIFTDSLAGIWQFNAGSNGEVEKYV